MTAGLKSAALSRRTGVAATDTLPEWNERYGALRQARTAGGERSDSEPDVERVEWLLLDEAFAVDVQAAFPDALQPFLARVGEAWRRGGLSVAQEHLATQAVRVRLGRRLSEARRRPGDGGARLPARRGHDVGLVTPAALLQADGWAVAYPGAGTPIGEAAALAAKLSARPLCLSTTLVDEASLPLRRSPNGTALVVGGSASTPGLAARPGADCAAGGAVQAVVEPRRLSAA